MNCSKAAVGDFRSQRKCFSISGSLLLMLLLLVAQCACRPPDELYENFDVGDDYGDVDNVEWHHVKMVDGILREDHPIIMYKEDFVSEDYDPNKSNKSQNNSAENISATTAHPRRKYKDINMQRRRRLNRNETEHYHALKPEKMYFDALPPTPVVATEADVSTASDYKFDPAKIRVEVISLASEDMQEPSKQLLNKRPKKYRRRMRRDLSASTDAHVVRKRNPYLRHQPAESLEVSNYLQQLFALMRSQAPQTPTQTHVKHAVPGKLWNSLNLPVSVSQPKPNPDGVDNRFGSENEQDRVVWGSSSNTRRTTTRPEQLWGQTTTTPRPTRRTAPPLFHDARPENADTSFLTRRPSNNAPPARTTPETPPESSDSAVSKCVWAIVNCCSTRDNKVRYSCFEQLGCRGSFWDLNPCADSIRENVINFVAAEGQQQQQQQQRRERARERAPEREREREHGVRQTFRKQHESNAADRVIHFGNDSPEKDPRCAQAASVCCRTADLSWRYECFRLQRCTRTIPQIRSTCG